MRSKSFIIGIAVGCLLLCMSFSAHAYTSLVAYGDSLSDDGDTGAFLPLPDGIDRFTDDKVWVELLADATGSTLYDVAFGGATTGIDNPKVGSEELGLQWQIGAFQSYFNSNLDMNETLFTVWAGANDFFQGREFGQAVNNIGTAVQSLVDSGAQNILIPNLPDLGSTKAFYGSDLQAQATGWSLAYNSLLESQLADLQQNNLDVNLIFLDVNQIFMEDLLEFDEHGNITNLDGLFWDDVHPKLVGHEAIAAGAFQAINAVPVPAPLILLGSGLFGLGALRRRFRSSVAL